MPETIDTRANSQKNIASRSGSRPGSVPYSDFTMASLAPIGTPAQNVGQQPLTPTAEAGGLVAKAGGVQLGTPEWEQIQLAQAIEKLRSDYSAAATAAGGSINDPYWKSEYDKAVEAALDDIRSQSAANRQTTEEAQKQRDFEAQQSARQQAEDRQNARDARKAAENSAMFQAGGTGLMSYLTTPRGGQESKLAWGILTGKDGKELTSKVYNDAGKLVSETPMMGPVQQGEFKAPQTPLESGFKGAGSYLKGAFTKNAAESYKTDASGKIIPESVRKPGYTNPGSTVAPVLGGTGLGMVMPGKNKGNALLQAGGGLGAGALDSAFGGSSPWSKLISSFGGSWANPFNKGAWGKNTGGTLAKLGSTALLSGLSRYLKL